MSSKQVTLFEEFVLLKEYEECVDGDNNSDDDNDDDDDIMITMMKGTCNGPV